MAGSMGSRPTGLVSWVRRPPGQTRPRSGQQLCLPPRSWVAWCGIPTCRLKSRVCQTPFASLPFPGPLISKDTLNTHHTSILGQLRTEGSPSGPSLVGLGGTGPQSSKSNTSSRTGEARRGTPASSFVIIRFNYPLN